jgi:hypothetical protein
MAKKHPAICSGQLFIETSDIQVFFLSLKRRALFRKDTPVFPDSLADLRSNAQLKIE